MNDLKLAALHAAEQFAHDFDDLMSKTQMMHDYLMTSTSGSPENIMPANEDAASKPHGDDPLDDTTLALISGVVKDYPDFYYSPEELEKNSSIQ